MGPEPRPQAQEDFPQATSFESFWQNYGDNCGFDEDTLRLIWDDTEALYSDELPYHNFLHVTETLVISQQLADRAEVHGENVDRRALTVAALFHDAGFYENHHAMDCKTKEEYSGQLMLKHAEKYGLSPQEVVTAHLAILKTSLGTKPETIEDKILVRSDLDNVTSDYEGFLHKTNLLREEAKFFDGYKGEATFATTSLRVLAEYISNDLALGEWETNHWSLKATQNLQKLAVEISKQQGISAVQYIRGLGGAAVKLLLRQDPEGD